MMPATKTERHNAVFLSEKWPFPLNHSSYYLQPSSQADVAPFRSLRLQSREYQLLIDGNYP